MRELEERILKDGKVLPGGVLKVGSFLNHCIDTTLLAHMADEVASLYKDAGVTKILTIEASGIALAAAAGMAMGVPVVFAKKHRTTNESDNVLIIDDFLANGSALRGLIDLVTQAGASVAGVAVSVEKRFQSGGDEFRAKGIRVESLAMISAMTDDGQITFCS